MMCGVVLAGLLLAGCSTGTSSSEANFAGVGNSIGAPAGGTSNEAAGSAVQNPAGKDGNEYNVDDIRVGDTITITISDTPTVITPIDERVKSDGTIILLQNQTFEAAGKKRGELEKEIRDRYVPDFFRTMTVSVRHQPQSQFYFVGGEVKRPDRQVYIGRMTVLKAIQSAGDFTDFARKSKVQLTRADGRTFHINWYKAQKDPKQDLEVFPGDTITVFRRTPWQR